MGKYIANNKGDQLLLSVIIVNYNGKHHLDACLSSLKEHLDGIKSEVIIVDNASEDGSVEYIEKNFPWVKLIKSPLNTGFAGGNNLGVRKATGEYLLLLNNDTILCDNILPAIRLFEEDESVGVLGIKMMGGNYEYRYSTGHFPSPLRLLKISSLFRTEGCFLSGEFDKEVVDTDWIEGSFLFTRTSIWAELKGLDEGYFMYVEDVDYCYRVKKLGFSVVYFPSLSYIHYGGYGESRLGMLIKGFRRYHRKFSSFPKCLLAQCVLTFGLLLRVILYGISFVIGRNQKKVNKAKACWKALQDSPW